MIRGSPWRSLPSSFSQVPENVASGGRLLLRFMPLSISSTPWKQRRKMRRTYEEDIVPPIVPRVAAATGPETAEAA